MYLLWSVQKKQHNKQVIWSVEIKCSSHCSCLFLLVTGSHCCSQQKRQLVTVLLKAHTYIHNNIQHVVHVV